MIELVDDPNWCQVMVTDDDAFRGAEVGQEAVGRLSNALGADLVLNTMMPALDTFRQNPTDWR